MHSWTTNCLIVTTDVHLQMVSMRRLPGPKNPAEMTYYVQQNGAPLSGTNAAKTLSSLDSQTMALTLGYFVQVQAERKLALPVRRRRAVAVVRERDRGGVRTGVVEAKRQTRGQAGCARNELKRNCALCQFSVFFFRCNIYIVTVNSFSFFFSYESYPFSSGSALSIQRRQQLLRHTNPGEESRLNCSPGVYLLN